MRSLITLEDFLNVHGPGGQQLAMAEELLKAALRLKVVVKGVG
jgi:hypothetical protein